MTIRRLGLSDFGSGNTTAAFGVHEWLIRAAEGEIQTPIGVNTGSVKVNELVMNYGSTNIAQTTIRSW